MIFVQTLTNHNQHAAALTALILILLLFPNNHQVFICFISAGVSVFDYIDRHAQRTPAFHNFMYLPDPNHTVLRPFNNLSDLQIWNYYYGEELKHGPSYDYELVIQDLEQVK